MRKHFVCSTVPSTKRFGFGVRFLTTDLFSKGKKYDMVYKRRIQICV